MWKTPVFFLICSVAFAQTGSEHEPVRYVGGVSVDLIPHEGRLRPSIGVANHQVLRVNQAHPELAEDWGWSYNHAPDMAYWNDMFYVEYLSNPKDEHIPPGQTLVSRSVNGREWEKPTVVFPPYKAPEEVKVPEGSIGYMMHQRMGFYVAPNGRLLVLAFYGHAEDPFLKGGIGRVVREAYKDGTYGPIYFIRYTRHADWNEGNTGYPIYTKSEDAGFVEACNALLGDALATRQWRDEDPEPTDEENLNDYGSAFNYFTRKDGKIVGLWKRSNFALSSDGGKTFSKRVKVPTLTMAGGKQWGQQTEDGRYAILYNPTLHDEHRYPLIAITSDDGIIFDDMVLVHSEVPPRRFYGRWKDFGPNYTRGIFPGNGNPPGDDLWATYSVNKEDIWVSRVPVPIRHVETEPVKDDFEEMARGGEIPNWNIYSPRWAPVQVIGIYGRYNVLSLVDEDPYDYARAVRVFPESTHAKVSFDFYVPTQPGKTPLEIDVVDRYGNRPVRVWLDVDGNVKALDGASPVNLGRFPKDTWLHLELDIEAQPFGHYTVTYVVGGEKQSAKLRLAEDVLSVERISFRTGPFRSQPTRQTPNQVENIPPVHPGEVSPWLGMEEPLAGADEKAPLAEFWIEDVEAGGV